jgi:uncharacterized protein (TIGR00369 family)
VDTAAFTPLDPDYAARVRASFERQGAMRLIGAQIAQLAPGECEIRLPYRDDLSQQHGFFHGGVLSTIADSAAGYAGLSLMPADTTVLTIEFKTNFLAPARGELLVAHGRVVKPGRTVTVAEAHAFAVDRGTEKLVATLTETMIAVTHHAEKTD